MWTRAEGFRSGALLALVGTHGSITHAAKAMGMSYKAAWDAIAFRQGQWYGSLPRVVDLAYKLEENTWNGNRRLQLVVEDLRPATRG